MRLDFFVKLKKWSSSIIYYIISVLYRSVLNILCVTSFVTIITMPDPQKGDMRHIR